jgi:hypothetical protein
MSGTAIINCTRGLRLLALVKADAQRPFASRWRQKNRHSFTGIVAVRSGQFIHYSLVPGEFIGRSSGDATPSQRTTSAGNIW